MTDLLAIAHIIHRLANTELEYCKDDIHMASPATVEARGCGDCEDLALWRFRKLEAEGVPPENMQISYLDGQNHAVLDLCERVGNCYRLEHGRGIFQIERMPNDYINPDNGQFYQWREE